MKSLYLLPFLSALLLSGCGSPVPGSLEGAADNGIGMQICLPYLSETTSYFGLSLLNSGEGEIRLESVNVIESGNIAPPTLLLDSEPDSVGAYSLPDSPSELELPGLRARVENSAPIESATIEENGHSTLLIGIVPIDPERDADITKLEIRYLESEKERTLEQSVRFVATASEC